MLNGDVKQAQQEIAKHQKEEHQQQGMQARLARDQAVLGVVFALHKAEEYRNRLEWIDDRQQCGEHADEQGDRRVHGFSF
jgi:hypothetical protein